jgi:hypothetical protein
MYEFEKVLLKPVIEPLDTNTQRVRRNLIVISSISFFYTSFGNGIDFENSSFVGIKFHELNQEYLIYVLILINLYFLVHFTWALFDHMHENCLRLTGVAIPMVRRVSRISDSYTLEPFTDDNKQSTIYSWWSSKREIVDAYENKLDKISKLNIDVSQTERITTIQNKILEIQYKSSYISEAMHRFEKGFWKFQRSQLIRWFILDFGIPFVVGFLSIILLMIDVFH